MGRRQVGITSIVGGAAVEVPTSEGEGAVHLLCDVGEEGAPFQVFRQEDGEVRACWDMLEDGIVEGLRRKRI